MKSFLWTLTLLSAWVILLCGLWLDGLVSPSYAVLLAFLLILLAVISFSVLTILLLSSDNGSLDLQQLSSLEKSLTKEGLRNCKDQDVKSGSNPKSKIYGGLSMSTLKDVRFFLSTLKRLDH